MLVARRFLSRSVGLALGLILLSVVVSGCFQTAGASLEPTATSNVPTAEPPTVAPPTAEPPTAAPPTAEAPTAEQPTAEPPTAQAAIQPTEAPTAQPQPTIVVVTETPAAVAQAPTAGLFVGGPAGTATSDRATQFALATQILSGATQTAAVDQTSTAVALGTLEPPTAQGQPGVQPTAAAPATGPLANVTGTPQGTLGAPGSGAEGGITADCVYTVAEGDRLYRIALRFNLSAEAVSRFNGIVNADMIVPGQRLRIPNCNGTPTPAPTATPGPAGAATATRAPAGGQGVYIVQEGDTLFGIATRYGVRVTAIAQANGLGNINLIYIGQRLVIP